MKVKVSCLFLFKYLHVFFNSINGYFYKKMIEGNFHKKMIEN